MKQFGDGANKLSVITVRRMLVDIVVVFTSYCSDGHREHDLTLLHLIISHDLSPPQCLSIHNH